MKREYNKILNIFIKTNYKWLVTKFEKRGLKFVYLPKMAEILSDAKYYG